jgi:hypothetical protein
MSATNINVTSTKRVRFSASESEPITSDSPSAAAETFLKATVVSSLLPNFRPVAIAEAKTLIKLHHDRRHFEDILKKTKAANKLPKSARINFRLTASKRTATTNEHLALVASAEQAASDCETLFKTIILKNQELEVEMITKEFQTKFVRTSAFLCKMFMATITSNDFRQDDTSLAFLLLTFLRDATVKLILNCAETEDAVNAFFVTQTIIPAMTTSRVVTENEKSIIHKWTTTLTSILVGPLIQFDNTIIQNNISIQLATIAKLHQTEAATEETSMTIETEATATPETLRNLISSEIKKLTKVQTKELASLKKLVKKDQRGAPTSASSTKKQTAATTDVPEKDDSTKNATKKDTPTASRTRRGQGKGKAKGKAAGSNNDTAADRQPSRRGKQGRKSNASRNAKQK